MDYQVNLSWWEARELAMGGAMIRRIGWLDRWFLLIGALWFLKRGEEIRVLRAGDWTRADALATDYTTTWPDQLICYNPPPDPEPEAPPLWNGCKKIGWGTTQGGTWLLPDGGRVISTKLHLEFGGLGTAVVSAAIIAPVGSSISIGGVGIEGSPFTEGKETFNVNPAREFPDVSSMDFDFQPGEEAAGSADIQVCFYPQTSQPEPGGPVTETLKFEEWPNPNNPSFPYGQREVKNPLAVAARLTISGGADDTFMYDAGAGWIPYSLVGRVFSILLRPGESIKIAVRNEYGGPARYDLTATWII